MSQIKFIVTNAEKRSYLLKVVDPTYWFPNFAGKETDKNQEGHRNFNIIIDEEYVEKLRAANWYVPLKTDRDGNEFYILNINVETRFDDWRMPEISVRCGDDGEYVEYDPSMYHKLDRRNAIEYSELIIRPRVDPRKGTVKGYLKSMIAQISDKEYSSFAYEELDDLPFN